MGGVDHLSLHHHLFPGTAFLLRLSSEGPRARIWNANWSRSQTISDPLPSSELVGPSARSLLLEAGLIAFVHSSGWVIRKCSLNQHLAVEEVQCIVNSLTSEPPRCGSCHVIWSKLCHFLAIQFTIPWGTIVLNSKGCSEGHTERHRDAWGTRGHYLMKGQVLWCSVEGGTQSDRGVGGRQGCGRKDASFCSRWRLL